MEQPLLPALAGCADLLDDNGDDDDNGDNGDDNGEDGFDFEDAEQRAEEFLEEQNATGADNGWKSEDLRGEQEVIIDAGFPYYDPALLIVDEGTEITWEVGTGHNVITLDIEGDNAVGGDIAAYETDITLDSGSTEENEVWEETIDETGVALYGCTPHVDNGQWGAVVVDSSD